ncbi:hypothetical protein RFI_24618 [Reticulomyxa filosa]|uniref:Uncharacterized protein n=1 Tax=Reticulomyxa filosa TaxID=46433 RepID=X6MH47_RETFI|nr:hypothetical protein RFI_24618 [Reticulomyxa filosa]|eukprot:ETO12757.1 hypothetical protein RFI_24618 [Reticulomyxa filosa]
MYKLGRVVYAKHIKLKKIIDDREKKNIELDHFKKLFIHQNFILNIYLFQCISILSLTPAFLIRYFLFRKVQRCTLPFDVQVLLRNFLIIKNINNNKRIREVGRKEYSFIYKTIVNVTKKKGNFLGVNFLKCVYLLKKESIFVLKKESVFVLKKRSSTVFITKN